MSFFGINMKHPNPHIQIFQLRLDRLLIWLQTSAVDQDSSFRMDDELDHDRDIQGGWVIYIYLSIKAHAHQCHQGRLSIEDSHPSKSSWSDVPTGPWPSAEDWNIYNDERGNDTEKTFVLGRWCQRWWWSSGGESCSRMQIGKCQLSWSTDQRWWSGRRRWSALWSVDICWSSEARSVGVGCWSEAGSAVMSAIGGAISGNYPNADQRQLSTGKDGTCSSIN